MSSRSTSTSRSYDRYVDLSISDFDLINPIDGSQFLSTIWTAPKDYPAGTSLLWHVDNHGTNEYLLIEVNIL